VLLGTGQLASAQTTDWTKANDELMRYFQVLIRIDSQDPPGKSYGWQAILGSQSHAKDVRRSGLP
jgi:hypothetical protein